MFKKDEELLNEEISAMGIVDDDDEYDDEEEDEDDEEVEETASPKKKRKAKRAVDNHNKLRMTLEINDSLILEMLNLIKSSPDQYNQGQRYNFSTKTAIITEALRIGLRALLDKNAHLNSVVEDSIARRTRTEIQQLSEIFIKIYKQVAIIAVNQNEQICWLKALLQKELTSDDPKELIKYRVEDLENIINPNVQEFIDELRNKFVNEASDLENKFLNKWNKLPKSDKK